MPVRHGSLLRSLGWAVLSSIITVICAAASAVIIVISNNDNIESWKVQPTVLLAVLSSVFNISLAAGLTIGVVMCWWRTALRGATATQLHYIWERGMGLNFTSALFAGWSVNKVAAATIIVAAAKFINGPLLQKATVIRSHDIIARDSMKLDLVQRLPDGWMGRQWEDTWNSFRTPPWALSARKKWWRNDTITTLNQPGYYCDGTCEGVVRGAGISHNCTSVTSPLNLSTKDNGTVVFAINSTVSESPAGLPFMLLSVFYISQVDDDCMAKLVVERCNIEAAIVKYPLIIQNNTVTFNQEKLLNMEVSSIYSSPGDSLRTLRGTDIGPLKGLSRFTSTFFYANATKTYDSAADSIYFGGDGTLPDLFYENEPGRKNNPPCRNKWKWSRPTDYLLNAIIYYMFIAALDAGREETITQEFEVTRAHRGLIFRSDYGFLAGALAAVLLALTGVLFLLWGSWELGRPASLSPLETAKAFEAPLMYDVDRNDSRGILDKIGHEELIYDGEKIIVVGDNKVQTTTEGRQ